MKKEYHRYLTRIYWSDDDEAYVAEVPALPGCVATGSTMVEAAKEIGIAIRLWLGSARKHGDPIPAPDLAREEIQRLAPILNYSKLARSAGINQNTLASKLRRNSPFTKREGVSILKVLESVKIPVVGVGKHASKIDVPKTRVSIVAQTIKANAKVRSFAGNAPKTSTLKFRVKKLNSDKKKYVTV